MARPRKKPVEEAKAESKVTAAVKEEKVKSAADVKPAEKESAEKAEAAPEAVKVEAVSAETKETAKAEVKPGRGRKKGSTTTKPAGKPASKRAPKKVEKELVEEVYVQFYGEEVVSNVLVDRIKEAYKNEGHRISSIKSLRVYINVEQRRAYYVINEKPEDKFIEF